MVIANSESTAPRKTNMIVHVKTFNDVHSFIKDGYSKVVNNGIISKLFSKDIRKNHMYKSKEMQEKTKDC